MKKVILISFTIDDRRVFIISTTRTVLLILRGFLPEISRNMVHIALKSNTRRRTLTLIMRLSFELQL